MNTVYCLSDPRTGEIRYVGKTCKRLNLRLSNHISVAKMNRDNCHKNNWIRSLLSVGLCPNIHTCEDNIPDTHINDKEKFWISYYRCNGVDLTNLTEGGEGHKGYKPSEETIRLITSKTRGLRRSQEVRDNIRKIRTGTKLGSVTRNKISTALIGRNLTETHINNIIIALRGKTRSKIRVNQQPNNAKLTIDNIRTIRSRNPYDRQLLADEFGVSASTITSIRNGRSWLHVK